MTRELSIAAHGSQPYFVMPMSQGAHGGAPKICLSLLAGGDMWGEAESARPRHWLFGRLGIDESRTRGLRQVHSKKVLVADELAPTQGDTELVEGDGLVTHGRDLHLFVRVADCYPIFLFDRQSGAFGVAHSGWRGTGIAQEALSLMGKRYGTQAKDVSAVLGPGIRACCYDVPGERAELFRGRFGAVCVQRREGREYLDLALANCMLLSAAGVEDITSITDCTACSPFLGSFRRQGPDDFTHMLALIGYFR